MERDFMAQIAAVIIFIAMFILIILDKFERHHVTLACAVLTLVVVFGVFMHSGTAIIETLNIKSIFTTEFWYGVSEEESSGINWATIIFIVSMMIMVEGMARVGLFRWLCLKIANLVHYQVIPIFITFMIMSAVLAMFIDSITVILFLAAVTVELARILKFNPIPMILAEIFCSNLGGSATMCGDPPNIIIGTSLHYSFSDFITNTGIIAGIALIITVIYFYLIFRRELTSTKAKINPADYPDPKDAITDKKGFIISWGIFLLAVVLLVTHASTHMSVALIGAIITVITLIFAGKHIPEILKRVDYKTALFFVGLFVVVGGLEMTGILELIAGFIGNICGGNLYLMVVVILWISAVASAFVDNIPFAATMVPIISSLAETTGAPIGVLAWTLSMGTDIGGSATPIGASANVVGTSVSAKSGYPIGWKRYCVACAPATVIVLVVSMICIFVRYC